MAEPEMIRATGDGVGIQLARWTGSGQRVLCVHGLTANCRCWDTIAASLTPRLDVAAVDLRGRGLSDKPSTGYSVFHHCRDIAAVMDDLSVERPALVGHSLGALIVLAFAALHPERVKRIVLLDGGGVLTKEQMDKVLNGIRPALERLGQHYASFEAYAARMKQAPFLNPWTAALEAYFRYEIEATNQGVRSRVRPEIIEEEIANLTDISAAQFYPRVRCPVLILRATEGMLASDDLVLPQSAAEVMVKSMPAARCLDLEGTHHYSIVFQPNAARDRVLNAFLGD